MFLGRLEDAAGTGERVVAFAPSLGAVLADLDADLVAALSGARIRLAVNGTLIADRAGLVLQEGDELAFLPPLSGG